MKKELNEPGMVHLLKIGIGNPWMFGGLLAVGKGVLYPQPEEMDQAAERRRSTVKERDLPIDRARHIVYTKKAKNCVLQLLHRDYDDQTCKQLWEKIQLQYCEFLRDEPPMAGVKIRGSIYDPILIFAWYRIVPDKPALEEVQQDIFRSFMGSFDALGKVFNLNRRLDNRLASRIFQIANDIRVGEIRRFPSSFRMGSFSCDRENGVIRYSFTQCPNAEFAKRHHMEDVLPVMCNCDHLAMQKLHACLIREGTCVESPCCDYCIVGDQNPITQEYELVKRENGLLVSIKK